MVAGRHASGWSLRVRPPSVTGADCRYPAADADIQHDPRAPPIQVFGLVRRPGDPGGPPLLQGTPPGDPLRRPAPEADRPGRAAPVHRPARRRRRARHRGPGLSGRRARPPPDGRSPRSSSGCWPTSGCSGCRSSGAATTSPPARPRRPGRPGSPLPARTGRPDGIPTPARPAAWRGRRRWHPTSVSDTNAAARPGPSPERPGDDQVPDRHPLVPSTRRSPRTRSSSPGRPGRPSSASDPWRVLRIMSEFVDGFDALAEVGPAVTVFGSARVPKGRPSTSRRARSVGAWPATAAP